MLASRWGNPNYHCIALRNTTVQLHLRYLTLQYTKIHYTIPRYSTQHYSTLHYTSYTTPQLQLQLPYINYTSHITLYYITITTCNGNSATLQLHLQLQLRLCYTTLHPGGATIAATLENTAPSTFRSISGFALPSVSHNI